VVCLPTRKWASGRRLTCHAAAGPERGLRAGESTRTKLVRESTLRSMSLLSLHSGPGPLTDIFPHNDPLLSITATADGQAGRSFASCLSRLPGHLAIGHPRHSSHALPAPVDRKERASGGTTPRGPLPPRSVVASLRISSSCPVMLRSIFSSSSMLILIVVK
jgi:hypothetical protein